MDLSWLLQHSRAVPSQRAYFESELVELELELEELELELVELELALVNSLVSSSSAVEEQFVALD